MNGISLFTGSSIGDLALGNIIPGYRTVLYVETSPYCCANTITKIQARLLDDAPIWDDVRTLDTTPYQGMVDIVTGGFPCQPFSNAGKRLAEDDQRNCWPDTFRIIREIRPRYAFLENVPALLTFRYARRIFADLASIGYNAEWDSFGPGTIGCPYPKKRLWLLCSDSGSVRLQGSVSTEPAGAWPKQQFEGLLRDQLQLAVPSGKSGRVAVWNARRMDRIKMCGNSQSPHAIARILQVSEVPHD